MLVHVIDIKGHDFWINPVHVKLIQQGKRGVSEIVLAYTGGWGTNLVIRVDRPMEDVAAQLNVGMPLTEFVPEDDFPAAGGAAVSAGVV